MRKGNAIFVRCFQFQSPLYFLTCHWETFPIQNCLVGTHPFLFFAGTWKIAACRNGAKRVSPSKKVACFVGLFWRSGPCGFPWTYRYMSHLEFRRESGEPLNCGPRSQVSMMEELENWSRHSRQKPPFTASQQWRSIQLTTPNHQELQGHATMKHAVNKWLVVQLMVVKPTHHSRRLLANQPEKSSGIKITNIKQPAKSYLSCFQKTCLLERSHVTLG